jgi:hypothetical protein
MMGRLITEEKRKKVYEKMRDCKVDSMEELMA